MSFDVKSLLSATRKLAPDALREAVGLAGIGCVVHGVGLIYVPAGWIAGGMALVAYAIIQASGTK